MRQRLLPFSGRRVANPEHNDTTARFANVSRGCAPFAEVDPPPLTTEVAAVYIACGVAFVIMVGILIVEAMA